MQINCCSELYVDVQSLRKFDLTRKLNLCVENEIIHMCSRIPGLNEPFAKLILLHPQSHLTLLIIRNTHEKLFHAGIAVTLANLRKRYWIVKGRQVVKKVTVVVLAVIVMAQHYQKKVTILP